MIVFFCCILVIGGVFGLGCGIVGVFCVVGDVVFIGDVDVQVVVIVVDEIGVIVFGFDIVDEVLVQVVCEWIVEVGGFDVLVNNVGVVVGGGMFQEVVVDVVDVVLCVNVCGMFFMFWVFGVLFVDFGYGFIVNILLIGVWQFILGFGYYEVMKVVVDVFICIVVIEFVGLGVCVNVVVFGFVFMLLIVEFVVNFDVCVVWELCIFFGMIVEVDQIMLFVLFFMSDVVSYIIGVFVVVDGGQFLV